MVQKFFNYLIIMIIISFFSCSTDVLNVDLERDDAVSDQSSDVRCQVSSKIDNLKIVNKLLKDFEKGKIKQILKQLSVDIVWTAAGDDEVIPFAGTFYGKFQVMRHLKNHFSLIKTKDLVIVNQVNEAEEIIISYTRLKGIIPSTEKTIDMEYVFTWTFNQRHKITQVGVTYNIASMELAFNTQGKGNIISNTSVSAEAEYFFDLYMSFKEWYKIATYDDLRASSIEYPLSDLPPDADVEQLEINGLEAEIVRVPDYSNTKIIVYFHGGGFCSGNYNGWRFFTYTLAKTTKIPVLSINYRLAPENPFPAAPEDCFMVYKEVLNDYSADNIALIGDSTGGGLVLSTVLLARENNIPLPGAVIPLSPWADLTNSSPTYISNDATDYTSKELCDRNAAYYLNGASATNPIASPVFADVDGFPPVYITVSSYEILLGDSIHLFNKLASAGVDVTLEIGDGMLHAWPIAAGLASECDRSCSKICNFIIDKL